MWIKSCQERLAAAGDHAGRSLAAFICNENGASIVFIGLLMPVLIGGMGLAAEVAYWQVHHRAMQNAADTAAIAAATNANPNNYAAEARGVTAAYGFADGTGQVKVTATNPASATNCSSNCYVVTITDNVPLFLSQVVGYHGNATVGNQGASTISASSVATSTKAYGYCILALGGSGQQGIRSDGSPTANLNGCNVMSNTSATCNGHNLGAAVGDAHSTDNGCGNIQNSNVPTAPDTYASLASNIPSNTCGGSYPQEPSGPHGQPLPPSNQLSGNYSNLGNKVVCGDQQLTGNLTLNNTTLVIENGVLDTNGYTLKGTGLTVIFSGTNNGSYQHIPTGGGTLDIAAPTSGPWSGVAMYQDPALTRGVDMSAAGNTPTWNLSGLAAPARSSRTIRIVRPPGSTRPRAATAACWWTDPRATNVCVKSL
jgi:Flp pilus assembly protein TadG